MTPMARKVICTALLVLFSASLVSAIAAPESGCSPGPCDAMAGMGFAGPESIPHPSTPRHGCCGTSGDRHCDVGARHLPDASDVLVYRSPQTRVNTGNSPAMAASGSKSRVGSCRADRPPVDRYAHTVTRSPAIYLTTLSLLI